MKGNAKIIIQLALSILIFYLFHAFYWKIFGLIGLKFTGIMYEIMKTIEYLIISIIVFIIYSGSVKSGKNKYKKALLNNIIYSISCFVFLIIITILLHDGLNYISSSTNVTVGYHFINYFQSKFTLSFALNLVRECLFVPFLLCVVFAVGVSNLFKRPGFASAMTGLSYGIIYGISLKSTFKYALITSITPAIIVLLLTYLYRTNHNIWSVIITYAIYILVGVFAISYIV